jgi:hypothetical protein
MGFEFSQAINHIAARLDFGYAHLFVKNTAIDSERGQQGRFQVPQRSAQELRRHSRSAVHVPFNPDNNGAIMNKSIPQTRPAAFRMSVLAAALAAAGAANAGPGSVVIKTDGDITATFGGQARIIPTSESNWDFGIAKRTGRAIANTHANEGGVVKNGYIRTEDRLYFNFAQGDVWDVYMALEFDSAFTQQRVDRAISTQGPFGDFGLERLNASLKLPGINSRFNAGWDVYGIDTETGLIYTDDDPGLNIKGGSGAFSWVAGYHKKVSGNWVPQPTPAGFDLVGSDNDRTIYTARLNYKVSPGWQVGLIYALDDLKVRGGVATAATTPNVDNNRLSAIIKGAAGNVRVLGQAVYSFGTAKGTGVANAASADGSYDIRAYALAGDLALDLHKFAAFSVPVVPHFGFYYTSGDKNPNDRKLTGYSAIVSIPRFGEIFGGENTILYDGNAIAGTVLYGNLPETHGNQSTALGVGGLTGTGRGDNPGLMQIGGGLTVGPWTGAGWFEQVTYKTNAYLLRHNANFIPTASTAQLSPGVPGTDLVSRGNFGVEWDNQLTLKVQKNTFLLLQASVLKPLAGGKAAAASLAGVANTGQFDKPAVRVAAEMLWNF